MIAPIFCEREDFPERRREKANDDGPSNGIFFLSTFFYRRTCVS